MRKSGYTKKTRSNMENWTLRAAMKAQLKNRYGSKLSKLLDERTVELAPFTILSYDWKTGLFSIEYPDGTVTSGKVRHINYLARQIQPDKKLWKLSPIKKGSK